ncbi:MAG: hypothetical protein ACHRXM_02890 [Isosphaerales bacterium]
MSPRSRQGVDVLDVRLRRFNHPVEVRPAVFDLIRSERRQVAAKLRAEGEAEYVTITSHADLTRDMILADAVDVTVLGAQLDPSQSAPKPVVSDQLQPAKPREKK